MYIINSLHILYINYKAIRIVVNVLVNVYYGIIDDTIKYFGVPYE